MTVFPKASGSFMGRMPPWPSPVYTFTNRDHLASGTLKLVSIMCKGARMRSLKNCSNVIPDATSTTRPSTSVLRL